MPPDLPPQPAREEPGSGARAIEVVALFESAIVEARHFSDPAGGRVRRGTLGLVVGGGIALATSLVLFLVAYSVVARERDAGGGLSSSGGALDVIAALLVVAGLGAIVTGLLHLHEDRAPRDYTVGSDPHALFQVEDPTLPAAAFPLLHSTGSEYQLLFTDGMRGDLTIEKRRTAFADLIASGYAQPSVFVPGAFACPIPDGPGAKVDFGNTTVLLRPVAAPRRYGVPLRLDWSEHGYTVGVAVTALLVLAGLFAVPPDLKSLSLDEFSIKRFAKFVITPPVVPEEKLPEWLQKQVKDPAGRPALAQVGKSKKMGNEKSKAEDKRYAIKGDKNNPDPRLARQIAMQEATKSGVLGILKAGSPFASIFSTDATALGDAADNAMGNLIGVEVGDAGGFTGGLGLVGHEGDGADGTGLHTIGLARIGTRGIGDGTKTYGHNIGLPLTKRPPTGPQISVAPPQIRGDLDPSIIRRVIRQHLNEIKFCYEQELVRNSDLYGRVMMRFTITGTGQVMSAVVENSTLGNPRVEACAAQAVRRMEFPRPQSGGVVIVGYPFSFNRSGGD